MSRNRLAAPLVEEVGAVQTIAVRAYVPPPNVAPPKAEKRRKMAPPSGWTLVFDTETTIDPSQRLRVGSYQLRHGDELIERGLFFDPESVTPGEIALLRQISGKHQLRLMPVAEFVDEVFFLQGYDLRASFVGFNLPFDLSRLATHHGSARGKTMRGGFTFRLSARRYRPAIPIKHLNARASLIQFAHPPTRRDNRRARKSNAPRTERRGSFIDLKTVAAALTTRSFSLATLADFLQTPLRKATVEAHGGPLTPEYVDYLVGDVEVTWQCYQALRGKYERHALIETHLGKILSEASLGKAYLMQMGVAPFRAVQPDFPDAMTGKIMSAYYGGRTEVRLRRLVTRVIYCDFLSMYPTVCTLMGLWPFVMAQGVTLSDTTEQTRELIEQISVTDLQQFETWKGLATIVKIKPASDALSARAKYDGRAHTIGVNFVTSDVPLYYTLADVIASKILTGKTPEILEAISFAPKAPQTSLRPISIAGNRVYRIDPAKDDFFKRLIDLRSSIKAGMKAATGDQRAILDAEQSALKILANSTSYGIFVEMNVSESDAHQKRIAFGPGEAGFGIETDKSEEPGRYFHPLLATLITGAARLMLAVAERLTLDAGLDWAFCDTDSLAIAKPDGLTDAEFVSRAQSICAWFAPLNPYESKGTIFKIEDANYAVMNTVASRELRPLFCYCISSKRYALFNAEPNGKINIRKASGHGLGHLLAPYGPKDSPSHIPAPSVPLDEIGVERWQYDVWHQIIRAALDGHPDQVDLSFHPALDQPAASRYAATTPALLRWFKTHNRDRRYVDQVRPFNFLIAFHARRQFELPQAEQLAVTKRGRRPKLAFAKPVAPYNRDIAVAAQNAFDRDTSAPISGDALQSYRELLAQYHLRPEAKFLNGNYVDQGRTERRHIRVTGITHIGKEANKWEEQYFTGPDENAEIEYGMDPSENSLDDRIRRMVDKLGQRGAARRMEVSRTTLATALKKGSVVLTKSIRKKIEQH